jgi:sigma-B regulation protein RsbU (phosphoserine phosphatase)
MQPASDVGGDYYDVLQHNGSLKIGIGDVTGHGLESGVLMLMVQTAIRTLMNQNETDSIKFLQVINQTIYDNVQRINSDKNLTLSLLDYHEGCLRLSGQHESVIVFTKDGSIELIDTFDLGFPVGLEENITDFLSQKEIYLNPGDGIVLYTDGITEAENEWGELYGIERLIEITRQNYHLGAQEMQNQIIADVRRHIGEQIVYDDITLLVIKQK